MAYTGADLLALQGNIKRDPQGYSDEFNLQWRHFQASRTLFLLSPSQGSNEFQDLVTFLSHVVSSYPDTTSNFASELMELLETHGPILDPSLRQTLVKALILLRNKGLLTPTDLLPLLFKLFRVQDKALRTLVFRHVTSDIKGANKKGRNERLNRTVQNFLYGVLADEHEATAKRGLAVLTEMWRRHVWRDARTANVIASATLHKSPRIVLAALKFFLGQDIDNGDGDDSGGDDDGDDRAGKSTSSGPTREDVYSAYHKGTNSSKKKKQKKLKRVLHAVKKATKKDDGGGHESFAALQLLNDPQGFAEKLFSRLRSGNERFETRIIMMGVISRAIGVHKLLVLNFYPFLQKYIAPGQTDVTVILASLVQACHELVPPDTLAPVLRQLVDQFVHDKARPEVMTIGLKTVREICTRAPLVMNQDLLQDLVEYKKFRDKEVSSAARGLISLFRELAPSMLQKRDRGRGVDIDLVPTEYGATMVADAIDGADLLEAARRAGRIGDEGELLSSDEGSDIDIDSDIIDSGSDGEIDGSDIEGDDIEGDDSDSDGEIDIDEDGIEGDSDDDIDDDDIEGDSDSEINEEEEQEQDIKIEKVEKKKRKRSVDDENDEEPFCDSMNNNTSTAKRPREDSIVSLKKQLAAKKAAAAHANALLQEQSIISEHGVEKKNSVPEDWGRILSQADFDTIRQLKHKRIVDNAMKKHGLKSASKQARAREHVEEEAEELLQLQERLGTMHEDKVNPSDLLGKRRGRRDKEERMASVLEGREGRLDFGAKSKLKKAKTGGLSNREKNKRKRLPSAAHSGQVKRRLVKNKLKSAKNFRGHVRKA